MYSLGHLGCVLLLLLPTTSVGFGTLCGSDGRTLYNHTASKRQAAVAEPNVKIALLGDQGTAGRAPANPGPVLDMIRKWIGSDLDNAAIVHSGDFDYRNNPTGWMDTINEYIPEEVPYFTTIGNHDTTSWTGSNGYSAKIVEREGRSNVNCQGESAVNQYCVFKGVHLVNSGIGTRGSGHASYIDTVFSQNPAVWKMCAWHKNQRLYQVGGKSDETGYAVYDMCRVHGAIIHTSHEHSYCRTKNMANFASQTVADNAADLTLKPEQTFSFVSGLGGKSIRSYDTSGTSAYPGPLYENNWFAAHAASNDNVEYGALLCTFHVDNNPNKARCEMVDITGKQWDSFTMYSENSPTKPSASNRTMERCLPPFLEFPITRSEDDATITADGTTQAHLPRHTLSADAAGHRVVTRFVFRVGHAVDTQRLRSVQLQVMGANEPNPHDATSDMILYMRRGGPQVRWTKEDEDFEMNEVWVSPDLTELLLDARQQPTWNGVVTLTVEAKGKVPRVVYSYDSDKCLAPTLTVQLEPTC